MYWLGNYVVTGQEIIIRLTKSTIMRLVWRIQFHEKCSITLQYNLSHFKSLSKKHDICKIFFFIDKNFICWLVCAIDYLELDCFCNKNPRVLFVISFKQTYHCSIWLYIELDWRVLNTLTHLSHHNCTCYHERVSILDTR